MKVYLPNASSQKIGGGWTFLANITKALTGQVLFVTDWHEADVIILSGVTMADWREVRDMLTTKKVILRVDNMPRKSRNKCRPKPHERMREAAKDCAAIVFQSEWARDWIGSYIGYCDKWQIIKNGVDTEIFNTHGAENDSNKYLIVQYNRDENKRIPEALDMFSEAWMKNPKATLTIVGRFSDDKLAHGFDFFRGEPYVYEGVLEDRKRMAAIMKACGTLLYPSYSDALPNTVTEAVACGMHVQHTGFQGVAEAATIPDPSLERMGEEYLTLMKNL